MQQMTKQKYNLIIIILGFLSAIGPFTIDMYLPGFESIARDLHVSVSAVGYSLTSYFIGISIGQLIYGPIIDRFGRKIPLLIGLIIYFFSAIMCALSPSFIWLILFRFLMAIGACVGMIASRAIVLDLFSAKKAADIFSTFMLIIALSPMLAPTAGGYISAGLGWNYIFYFLAGFVVLLFIVVFALLPESKKRDFSISLNPTQILIQYIKVCINRQFVIFTLISGLSLAALFTYVSSAPFMLLDIYGLSQTQFGWFFALIACGLISGSQINRLLLKKLNPRQITRSCIIAQIGIGIFFIFWAKLNLLTLPITTSFLFTFLFCTGMINPNTVTLALEPFSKNVGSASALLGFIQMVFGSIASGIISVISGKNLMPLTIVISTCALLGFILISIEGWIKSSLSEKEFS